MLCAATCTRSVPFFAGTCTRSVPIFFNCSSVKIMLKDIGNKKFYSLYLLYLPMEYLITHFRESIAYSC